MRADPPPTDEQSKQAGWRDSEDDWAPSAYSWYVTAFLTLAFALAYIDRQVISLLVGPIKADLGLNDVEISLLGGLAFVLFYTFMGIPLGRLTDRTHRIRLIAAGMFFWSLMTMACGLARSFTQLFLARVGVGVGEATLSPAALSIIADYFPRKKLGTASSIYLTGSWIGTGLAFILGGLVIDFVGDVETVSVWLLGDIKPWQLVFIVVGAPGIALSLFTLTVREPLRRNRLKAAGDSVPIPEVANYLWVRRRFYLLHFIGFGLFVAFGIGVAFWSIEYFVRTFEVDRSWISYRYGALAVVFGASGALSAGVISDACERRGFRTAKLFVPLIGMCLMFPLGLSLAVVPNVTVGLAVIALMTFCTSFPYGPAAAAIQVVTPNEMRGVAVGVYLFIANSLGLVIGPTIIAMFTEYVFGNPDQLSTAMSLAAAVLVPVAIMSISICRTAYDEQLGQLGEH